jgi:hypothetical protein
MKNVVSSYWLLKSGKPGGQKKQIYLVSGKCRLHLIVLQIYSKKIDNEMIE